MKTHLGHYEIVAELGRGGMGVVYKGFEPALNRFVAIKELSPSLAHDANLVERFLREARSMAVLNDPHIIQVYFIGTDEHSGQPFFAMEFVEGDSLSGMLKREGRLPVETALKIMHQTAQGLGTAHDKGVIHRDLKPGNLMITPRGHVKIADFGIALATQDFAKKLTSTGEFVGTPGYLSPEVCLGKLVDQRSDIFALGIVLFEMLSGRMPFIEESPLGMMLEVVKAEFPDIRQLNNDVDAQTVAVLARMVAKEPADRFQDCHQLADALEAHPLVARGGTLKLSTPKPAASAATMIGSQTVPSQLQRVPTPPPVVSRPTSAPAAPVANAAPVVPPPSVTPNAAEEAMRRNDARPSVLERQENRRSSMAPLAIAAVLVLALAGSVFAFRAQIASWLQPNDEVTLTVNTDASATARPAAVAGVPPSDTKTPSSVTTTESALGTVATGSPVPVADAAPTTVLGTDAISGDRPVTAPTVPAQTAQFEPASVDTTTRLAKADETPGGGVSGRPRLAMARALAGNREGLATAMRNREGNLPPPPPRVVVVTIGDEAITGPAKQQIEEVLMGDGFDVLDAELVAGLPRDGDLPRLFSAIRREAAVVVVVRADAIGSQQLAFYGQVSTLYSANLSVRAYVVNEKRALSPGFRSKVDFTSLNAMDMANEAIAPNLGGLVRELAPYRRSRG